MAADFNKPVTTDTYVDVLEMLRSNQEALARMFATGTTVNNIPFGSVRFDSGKFQTWNGSAWVDVPVSVDGGGTGAQSAADARVALGTHDAANLTTGVMDSDRVPGLDAAKIISGTLTLNTTGSAASATYATSAGSAGSASTAGTANAAPWSGITGKPAYIGAGSYRLEAREAIGAVGIYVNDIWSGPATDVNMNALSGGWPGNGWYLVSAISGTGGGGLTDFAVFLRAGRALRHVYGVNYHGGTNLQISQITLSTSNVLSARVFTQGSSTESVANILAISKIV